MPYDQSTDELIDELFLFTHEMKGFLNFAADGMKIDRRTNVSEILEMLKKRLS